MTGTRQLRCLGCRRAAVDPEWTAPKSAAPHISHLSLYCNLCQDPDSGASIAYLPSTNMVEKYRPRREFDAVRCRAISGFQKYSRATTIGLEQFGVAHQRQSTRQLDHRRSGISWRCRDWRGKGTSGRRMNQLFLATWQLGCCHVQSISLTRQGTLGYTSSVSHGQKETA
jgi:hypothetical protein